MSHKKGHIAFKYFASEANIVIEGKGIAEVVVDEKPIMKKMAGKDIIFKKGKSYVKINGSDIYNIIKSKEFNSGVLKVTPFKGMKVYAYTFG